MDLVTSVALGIIALVTGALGFNISVHPITLGQSRRAANYKIAFLLLSIPAAILIIVQGIRADRDKKAAAAAANRDRIQAAADMAVLRTEAQTANKAQRNNTLIFTNLFTQLSGEVSELRTQVRTENLEQKLASVQTELKNTQKAMAPPPKAELKFSFFPWITLSNGTVQPATSIKVPNRNGIFHVEITLLNLTEVIAMDGEMTIVLCDKCGFAALPKGFQKLEGAPDTERFMRFDRLQALTGLNPFGVDVVVPPGASSFEIGFRHRCANCVLIKKPDTGIVYVSVRP